MSAACESDMSDEWVLTRPCYDPREDGYYETLFALSNGRLGLRATVDFDAGGGQPGFFHADVYAPGLTVASHLVNLCNPDYWQLLVGGVPLPVAGTQLVAFSHSLDMRAATVSLELTVRDHRGRDTQLRRQVFLPAEAQDAVVCVNEVRALNHTAPIALALGADWREGNGDFGGTLEGIRLHNLDIAVPEAAAERLHISARLRGGGPDVHLCMSFRASGINAAVPRVERARAVVVASREGGGGFTIETRAAVAIGAPPAVLSSPLAAILSRHRAIWTRRWRNETTIVGPASDRLGLRYAQFQLLQCADATRQVQNVPARGLTSEYHSGHFFFNSELYLNPYFALTAPDIARSMLRFRIATLEEAERCAARTGFHGARFPEESDRAGRPAAPALIADPFTGVTRKEWSGELVFHLSACVIHSLATYLAFTGDAGFFSEECVRLTARAAVYLADLMRHDPRIGKRGARAVMCFDEFHFPVDHHAATNALAAWALQWCAGALDRLERAMPDRREELSRYGADRSARERWRQIAADTFVPAPRGDGVWPLFHGYFELPDQTRQPSDAPLPSLGVEDQQRADRLDPFSTQLTKQADVLLLFALLPHLADRRCLAANLAFYEARTIHGSSLSLAPHALAAARTGDLALARQLVMQSARYNLDFAPREHYRNGIHFGAYAGALLALIHGIAGFRGDGDEIALDPALPREWTGAAMTIAWRGRRIAVEFDARRASVCHVDGDLPLAVRCNGRHASLAAGGKAVFELPARSLGTRRG